MLALLPIGARAAETRSISSRITEASAESCSRPGERRDAARARAIAEATSRGGERVLRSVRELRIADPGARDALVAAYERHETRSTVIAERESETAGRRCTTVTVRVEVIPDATRVGASGSIASDDPDAPLHVELAAGRERYDFGDRLTLSVRGNRPFYGRVVYEQSDGTLLLLLPNDFRSETRFEAGRRYEIPAPEDGFDLEVGPPAGTERITLYASPVELGAIESERVGPHRVVTTARHQVPLWTRGIRIVPRSTAASPPAGSPEEERSAPDSASAAPLVAEFVEATTVIEVTGP